MRISKGTICGQGITGATKGEKMYICLRKAGDRKPSAIISNVRYFEQLPSHVQFTIHGDDQTSFIAMTDRGEFMYGGDVFDFCQVYA